MIVAGSPVCAWKGREIGLVDQRIEGQGLAASAIAYARAIDAPRRTRDRRVSSDAGAFERFAAANARKIKDLDAPKACIAAIKASVDLPFDEGQALERELFAELEIGRESCRERGCQYG